MMHITDLLQLLQRLPPKLRPQQPIDPHGGPVRMTLRDLNRPSPHPFRLGDLVHDPVLHRLRTRPLVRLQQHLPRDLRAQLEPGQRPDPVEVQSQVHRRHAEEAALAVHDAVVAAQRERTRPAKGVARHQRDGRVRVVQQRGEQGVEAVRVGEAVRVALVQVEARAPELGVGALDDDGAGGVGWDEGFDVAERGDDGLREAGGEAVLGQFAHGYYMDILWVGVGTGYGQVLEGLGAGGDGFGSHAGWEAREERRGSLGG